METENISQETNPKEPQRLIPKTKFADLCGFTKAYVTRLSKGKLKAGVVKNSINLNHPDVVAYLKSKSVAQPPVIRQPATVKKSGSAGPIVKQKSNKKEEKPQVDSFDLIDYEDWTIKQVQLEFGTEYQFKEFLAASKIISALKIQEIEILKRRGELVSRDLVSSVVFKGFETLFLRIVSDGPKKISRKIYSMTKGGSEPEQCEAETREILSKLLKSSKKEIIAWAKKI